MLARIAACPLTVHKHQNGALGLIKKHPKRYGFPEEAENQLQRLPWHLGVRGRLALLYGLFY